jgi:hypothetical protein
MATQPSEPAVGTQWICDPTEVQQCPCAALDGDRGEFTCDCASEPSVGNVCGKCASPMVLINVDTGEPVPAEAATS